MLQVMIAQQDLYVPFYVNHNDEVGLPGIPVLQQLTSDIVMRSLKSGAKKSAFLKVSNGSFVF